MQTPTFADYSGLSTRNRWLEEGKSTEKRKTQVRYAFIAGHILIRRIFGIVWRTDLQSFMEQDAGDKNSSNGKFGKY